MGGRRRQGGLRRHAAGHHEEDPPRAKPLQLAFQPLGHAARTEVNYGRVRVAEAPALTSMGFQNKLATLPLSPATR